MYRKIKSLINRLRLKRFSKQSVVWLKFSMYRPRDLLNQYGNISYDDLLAKIFREDGVNDVSEN